MSSEYTYYEGCRYLVAKIIHHAITDLDPSKRRAKWQREEARRFLMSEYAKFLADHIEINIDVIRERIIESKQEA